MEETWINPLKKLPGEYDLLLLKTERGNLHGWWSGHQWMGLRIKSSDNISGWVRSYIKNE